MTKTNNNQKETNNNFSFAGNQLEEMYNNAKKAEARATEKMNNVDWSTDDAKQEYNVWRSIQQDHRNFMIYVEVELEHQQKNKEEGF